MYSTWNHKSFSIEKKKSYNYFLISIFLVTIIYTSIYEPQLHVLPTGQKDIVADDDIYTSLVYMYMTLQDCTKYFQYTVGIQ